MNRESEDEKVVKRVDNGLQAGIAGAGGGTIFVLIADGLPDSWGLKPILIYIAPSISIGLSVIWLWLKKIYNEYSREKKYIFTLRKLDEMLNDPFTSASHKEELIKTKEKIQLAMVELRMEEIRTLYNKDSF